MAAMTPPTEGDGADEPTFSDRGFAQYGDITCDYGSTVRIYESSSAEAPHIWLAVEMVPDLVGPDPGAVAAHLSLAQARRVRDTLDAAINRAEAT